MLLLLIFFYFLLLTVYFTEENIPDTRLESIVNKEIGIVY